MENHANGWGAELRAQLSAELHGGMTIEQAEEFRPDLFAELRVDACEELRTELRDDLQAELRDLGALAQDGLHSLKVRAGRALIAAAAAGAITPSEAAHWTRIWLAASGARVSAASMPGAVSKVKVWIAAGRSEAGLATLATLDMVASARPELAGRYFEKATTALRRAARAGHELTREECAAILAGPPQQTAHS